MIGWLIYSQVVMPRIFISYRREDSAQHANRICTWLKAKLPEASVFIDLEGILPGDDFVRSIRTAISSADVLLVACRREIVTTDAAFGV
jgi:hypothetical protein